MRLGILVPEFPAQTHAFFWRDIRALRALGHHVSIFSTRPPQQPGNHEFAAAAATETHYLFPPKPAAALTMAAHPVGLAKALGYVSRVRQTGMKGRARVAALIPSAALLARIQRREKLDHLHVHSSADAAHVAALAHLLGGSTYSLHLHGDLRVYGKDHATKTARALFVATASRPLEAQLIQLGLPQERIITITMGVETDIFVPAETPAVSDTLRLLTVARLNRAKGHSHGINAVKMLVDRGVRVHYTVVGAGPERDTLQKQIDALKLTEHVTLAGLTGEGGVMKVLQSADVFLLPSVGAGEASPVAVMEAMACGVPAVCSIIGGVPDMITDKVDGLLVPQHNEVAIASAIEDLAADSLKRNAMANAARERAVRQFSSRAGAQKLIDMIVRHRPELRQ